MSMVVAGGFYYEHCMLPRVDDGFGSGGRAAFALAASGIPVDWHYYCPPDEKSRVPMLLAASNLSHHSSPSDEIISFRYVHPLSKPLFYPQGWTQSKPLEIEGDTVLRFGFMEGDAIVSGSKVVYDPQSPNRPVPYRQNGSTAQELAIVLNADEVLAYGCNDDESAAVMKIANEDGTDIVIVKAGVHGCRVYEKGNFAATIPPYHSPRVYKIGTGDIFSAAFAYHWAIRGVSPADAADAASRCTAQYCGTRIASVQIDNNDSNLVPISGSKPGKVYLASPFFTVSELWLVEETWSVFKDLGIDVFSPYHEVGLGEPDTVVAPDLEGLRSCTSVLAIIDGCDPGTIFEIGYAVNQGIPVVVLSQNSKKSDQTMMSGAPNCSIVDDYATAVYHAAWESLR